jgi:tetratricopeptide (TPR) repeat protein
MKNLLIIITFGISVFSFGQVNCNILPTEAEQKACEIYNNVLTLVQGSKETQILLDQAIYLAPNFASAYKEKSVPYFKRGFILEGLNLINKAIELDPKSHLCYRASWYFQSSSYKLFIDDMERYYSLPNAYHQHTPSGQKDMRLLLAMAYAKLGNTPKGLEIMEQYIENTEKSGDFFPTDYYTLGVLYVLYKNYEKAIDAFNKQITVEKNFPDTYYYMGLAYEGLSKNAEAKESYQKALLLFDSPIKLQNEYRCYSVYLSEVVVALKQYK